MLKKWFYSKMERVRALLLINVGLLVVLAPLVPWTWASLGVAALMFAAYNGYGIVMTAHRYWAHKQFEWRWPWMKWLGTFFASVAGTGSVLGWAGLHRMHHHYSDEERDPHWARKGLWPIATLDYDADEPALIRHTLDLVRIKPLWYAHLYWLPIVVAWAAALTIGFGLPGLVFGFLLPSVAASLAQGMTNYINHTWGYRNHETSDDTTNNLFMAYTVNFGDGLHNNHHNNPKKSNLREKWWEFDMAGEAIDLVKAV